MSLEAFAKAAESEHSRELIRHWSEARGQRPMPGWNDIRPASIKKALPFVWSWKFDSRTGEFTGRLAGARVLEVFGGRSSTGVKLAEMYQREIYEFIHARFKRVVMTPEFFRGHGLPYHRFDQYYMGERIILPLAEDGVHGDGIIGVTDYRATDDAPPDDVIRAGEIEEWFTLG